MSVFTFQSLFTIMKIWEKNLIFSVCLLVYSRVIFRSIII